MFEILFYANITCSDATNLISRIKMDESMSRIEKNEIVQTLKEATPHCSWDASD